jgi:HK97 family phage major capsid protein/HK97 family phage prohead protease
VDRAYSIITVKSVDTERRVISGIATTPTPDDAGDVIEPLGVSFRNPLPLLFHHERKHPVGHATFAPPTADGIAFEASFPIIAEPGTVKDRVDEAWHSVKAGLIRGVSVGLRALGKDIQKLKDGGLHILKSEVFELSLVTIPANVDATILAIKSFDAHDLAVSGPHETPAVAGNFPVVHAVKAAPAMNTTIPEQITSFENTRAAKNARALEIMTKAADAGVTLDAAQSDEYDELQREIQSVDAHLGRLRSLEKLNVVSATPIITKTADQLAASDLRGGHPVITVKANVPKGTAFTRYVMAKVVGKNSISDAIRYAEGRQDWMDQTPEVVMMLKAAVNPGTIAEPAWAAPLAVQQPSNDFLDLLRPELLLGKIPGLRKGEFNISMPVQTGGGTYTWVGEGAPKPVGNLQFSSVTLGIAKAAGIIVISEELARISKPDAEMTVRNDMLKGMRQYIDQQFIDPTVAAVTNVSPASITNLANGYATAGTSADNARTDIKKGITLLTAANYPISEVVIVMSEANAFAMAAALTTNGQMLNPSMTAKGGSIFGVPVVTSQTAGSVVAFVHAPSILFADGGGVNIDVSREASVEMNTTPTSPVSASSAYVSLWQLNLIGLRADWFVNWKRARTTSVVYTTATYV